MPFELGKKRGKVFVPTYNEAEMEAIRRKEAVAEAVRLDDDEEAALGQVGLEKNMKRDIKTNPEILCVAGDSERPHDPG